MSPAVLTRFAVIALFATAQLLSFAVAAEQENPACALLTEEEAGKALGAAAEERIINPEMTGVSDCGWMAENGGSIALNRASGLAFQGTATAADSYRSWRKSLGAASKIEDLDGYGDAAFISYEKKVETRAIVVILRRGTVLLIGAYGVSRAQLLHLAELSAQRL